MSDPFAEDNDEGVADRWLKRLPGFGGYFEQSKRQASEEQARKLVVDALTSGKSAIEAFARDLLNAGNIDAIPACDRLRGRIDLLISRLRGAPAGYSNFFDSSTVTEDAIEDLYDHDLAVLDAAEKITHELNELKGDAETASKRLPDLSAEVEALHERVDKRAALLHQVANEGLLE